MKLDTALTLAIVILLAIDVYYVYLTYHEVKQ
jgi:hypothetical protein